MSSATCSTCKVSEPTRRVSQPRRLLV
eukprot:COSAG02_NODE_63848_length_262_cov_0.631902_1_plen_26_part_01